MRWPKYEAHTKYIQSTHFIMTIGCAIKQNNTMTSKTEHNFQYKIFTAKFQMYMYILANYVLPVICVLHIKLPHTCNSL